MPLWRNLNNNDAGSKLTQRGHAGIGVFVYSFIALQSLCSALFEIIFAVRIIGDESRTLLSCG